MFGDPGSVQSGGVGDLSSEEHGEHSEMGVFAPGSGSAASAIGDSSSKEHCDHTSHAWELAASAAWELAAATPPALPAGRREAARLFRKARHRTMRDRGAVGSYPGAALPIAFADNQEQDNE